MSKEAQNRLALTDEAKEKLDECVAALAACGFGPGGPPLETTFAQIEEFGHEMGKMVARALDEKLADQHANHFQDTAACPCCKTQCPIQENSKTRNIQTSDSDIPLREPLCHCPVCNRDFCLPSEAGKPCRLHVQAASPCSWGRESDSQGRRWPTAGSEGSDRRLMERSASEPDSAGYRGECAKRHDARYMNSDSR